MGCDVFRAEVGFIDRPGRRRRPGKSGAPGERSRGLSELERYTQARIGNIRAPETTGKFAAATFEHDTARPVEGYAAAPSSTPMP